MNENDMNDELLISYLLQEAPAPLRADVERWIAASPANQRYFEHVQLIWETSKKIQLPKPIDENEAWARFQQRTRQQSQPSATIRPIARSFNWMRAAAVFLISLGALSLSYFLLTRSSSSPVTFASAATPAEDTLPDGSVVTLNKHSVITYDSRLKGKQRTIQLRGEAFFKVTPDKTKPFVIEVNDVTITVVGTSFNVKNINGQTEVTVETGIVEVTKRNKTITLQPREKVLVPATDSVFSKQPAADKLYNYYQSKEFVCDNTPLWKLVEILNEAYDVNISIARNEVRNYPLTTTFYNESLDNILGVIAETFNITVERNGREILLR